VADQPPSAPQYGDLQSNPDSVLAKPPAAFDGADPGMHDYCKHAAASQLGYQDGTSDGRCNKGASGQQA
jgi:hypothetical protein